ncbi:ectonucleotide pyrophosphatase/phosphodiesterase family member 5 [Plakobranchus ocellatus]|uniref:Ectonucleotide pyrophosphatase/phosphodiesterase family member 5 n=1 Tax=Plakobranchus ocellatus TaxID=259542 RepID=A0AAV4BBA5_9GAST|nr:ectonucleotide pyrophosphatase/phosphodiesterase family member 5 [Plakobranchus ocellatus]
MDGFRHDYLSKTDTPNFDSMISAGVTMPYVNNSFNTATFPSHYTMATGLFSESHGIVSNAMYDPVFDSTFSKKNKEPRWWDGGEPIWITATKANKKAGVFFWPGSDVAVQGIYPAEWRYYQEDVPFEDRVRAVVSWLSNDDFDLAIAYFNEPDSTGHEWGPDHQEMLPVIRRMDRLLGFLMEELEKAGLKNATVLQRFGDKGDHGYDNTLDSMKPFFIAQGPAFKQGASVEPIQNVDIYPLICFLLEIEPSANNGSLTRAKLLLNDKYLNGANLKTGCNFAFVTLLTFIVVHIRPFI